MGKNDKDNLEVGATEYEDYLTEEELASVNEVAEPEEEKVVENLVNELEPSENEENEESEEKDKKDIMIPKARLDQEIRNRRLLETEIANIKEEKYKKEEYEAKRITDSKVREYQENKKNKLVEDLEDAFVNGDMKELVGILEERDKETKAETINELRNKVPEQIRLTKQEEDFERVRLSIEAEFPFLDPKQEGYDKQIVDTIVGFTEAEIRSGKEAAQALTDATSKVLIYEKPKEIERFLQKMGNNKKGNKEENLRLDEKIQAAKSQPPEMSSSVSQNMQIPDFSTMSEEDFDKLSAKEIDNYMIKMGERG